MLTTTLTILSGLRPVRIGKRSKSRVTLPPDVVVDMLHLQVRHAQRYLAHVRPLERLPTQSGRVLGYLDQRSAWPALWDGDAEPAPGPHLDGQSLQLGVHGLDEHWRRRTLAAGVPPAAEEDASFGAPGWLDLSRRPSPRTSR